MNVFNSFFACNIFTNMKIASYSFSGCLGSNTTKPFGNSGIKYFAGKHKHAVTFQCVCMC